MEVVWLALAVGFAIWVLLEIYRGHFEQIKIYSVIPVVAFAMWYFRRWFRKKYEKTMRNQEQSK